MLSSPTALRQQSHFNALRVRESVFTPNLAGVLSRGYFLLQGCRPFHWAHHPRPSEKTRPPASMTPRYRSGDHRRRVQIQRKSPALFMMAAQADKVHRHHPLPPVPQTTNPPSAVNILVKARSCVSMKNRCVRVFPTRPRPAVRSGAADCIYRPASLIWQNSTLLDYHAAKPAEHPVLHVMASVPATRPKRRVGNRPAC
jgi:hypothetical protein